MKLVLYLVFSLLSSVGFLLYLNTLDTFLPLTDIGSYNWINIITVVALISIAIFSLVGIIVSIGQIPFRKGISNISIYISIKYSGIVTLFLIILWILYFFHLLTWYSLLTVCILLGILIVTI